MSTPTCYPDNCSGPPENEVCIGCAEAGRGLECKEGCQHCANCGLAGEDQIERHREVFCNQDCLDEFEFMIEIKEAS